MAVTVVQVSSASAAWTASFNCNPTLPSSSTTGNRIIALATHQQFDAPGATTISAAGYGADLLITQAFNRATAAVLDKSAAGAAETPTFTASNSGTAANSFGNMVLLEVAGLASSPFVLSDSGVNSGNGTALSVASAATLSEASGIAVVAISGTQSMAGGTWPPAGWTDIHSSLTGNYCAFAYVIFSTTAQLTAAMSITTGEQWAGALAIFAAPSGVNTGMTPSVGAETVTGGAPGVVPASNNVIAPLTA